MKPEPQYSNFHLSPPALHHVRVVKTVTDAMAALAILAGIACMFSAWWAP